MTKTKKDMIKGLTKTALQAAAYIGSGAIAGAYIATAPFSKVPSGLMKACIWIGGACIQDIVADKACKNIGEATDSVFKFIETFSTTMDDLDAKLKEVQSDGAENTDECEC